MVVKGRKSHKKPPIFSHEFFIQNHADIISCIMVVFAFGMFLSPTSSICYAFVILQYAQEGVLNQQSSYSTGLKDICTIFYYSLLCIIIHSVHQEYVLDKMNKRLRLSKIKTSMFNESGQLLLFSLVSIIWSGDLIIKENLLLNTQTLWEDYPHLQMSFVLKSFFIAQIAYWLHCYPELYLCKIKREEILSKLQFYTMNACLISALYIMNFNRLGVLLIFLHYLSEGVHHFARLLSIIYKEEKNAKPVKIVSHIIFAFSRIGTIVLSLITFQFLSNYEKEDQSFVDGNYNTFTIRYSLMVLTIGLQVILSLLYRKNDLEERITILNYLLSRNKQTTNQKLSMKKKKDRKSAEENELTEVDQNIKKKIMYSKTKKLK